VDTDYVILVDEQDTELGIMEKLDAHLQAKLHRAVSVFIFNSDKKILLQKRAVNKYHSANLWTNTCCSHPKPGESTDSAAQRRLREEMGLDGSLQAAFNFTYSANLDNGITEHEFDHVFFGFMNDIPTPNPQEASDYKYMSLDDIENELQQNPEQFTEWFKLIFDKVKTEISKIK
jgi:isopentenyl-diphosphate delta-isomerase